MIALVLLGVAACVLAPLLLTFWSRKVLRGRRELALALHRLQLTEIDRDLAADRISVEDHATARLEIQRRILAADDSEPAADDATAEPLTQRRTSVLMVGALLVVPLGAACLYLIHGEPQLPGEPYAARIAAAQQRENDENQLISRLRDRLTQLDPKSDQARQGYVLLGNVEATRENLPAAVEAWRNALDIRYDATLAAQTAEAMTRIVGHVTPETEAMFRQALASAPPDAPWKKLVDQRLAEAGNAKN